MFGNSNNWQYISSTMKNLVIHPKDPTTEFLTAIYTNLKNKTVITGGISKSEIRELIEIHDRAIMLGHGASLGLMYPRQFPDAGMFILDGSIANSLRNKSSCIYIWCHADQFLRRYGLSGLCSGMFISERGEADLFGLREIDTRLIDQSNEGFSSILSKYINEALDVLCQSLLLDYEVMARTNPIARFNFKRLHLLTDGINGNLAKIII